MRRSLWKSIGVVAYSLLLVGALNWGFVAPFEMDGVGILFGPMSMLSRCIYGLVGLAALYDLASLQAIFKRWDIHLLRLEAHVPA